jgi:hypothetical protein
MFFLSDASLSLRDRGLLVTITGGARSGQTAISLRYLSESVDDGLHAVRVSLARLEARGYVVRGQRRRDHGRITPPLMTFDLDGNAAGRAGSERDAGADHGE